MIVLIHTSKTMRPPVDGASADGKTISGFERLSQPVLLPRARELANYLKTLSTEDIVKTMKVSSKLAGATKDLLGGWTDVPGVQRAALDSFLGDIYSGLQVADLTTADRVYANEHVRILSGLYGVLKPLDGIYPYRFEMGYRVPDTRYANLYSYWGAAIYDQLPKNEPIIDLTAVEYGKTVTKYAQLSENNLKIVTPRFLTISPKTGEPTFVVVHAKIARGAFAHWIITNRIESLDCLREFNEIGYRYSEELSTSEVPVYIAKEFKGIGLSVRLT